MRAPRPARIQRLLAALLLVLLAGPATSDLYEWTDENGRTHYSNEPRPGADPVGLKPLELEPADSPEATETDAIRRERLKRQRLERWVDSEKASPEEGSEDGWIGPDGTSAPEQAPPIEGARHARDEECRRLTGMTCDQLEAWKKSQKEDCRAGDSRKDCAAEDDGAAKRPAAKAPSRDRFADDAERLREKQLRQDEEAARRHRDSVLHRK